MVLGSNPELTMYALSEFIGFNYYLSLDLPLNCENEQKIELHYKVICTIGVTEGLALQSY